MICLKELTETRKALSG